MDKVIEAFITLMLICLILLIGEYANKKGGKK